MPSLLAIEPPPQPPATSRPSDTILERLTRLHPKSIDLSLGRVERLLDRLGNPERSLPPVVHVAGTNGKGSAIAYLRAMLESAGRRVHVYTSPHLVRFHERIRLAGELIPEPDLAALLEECESANGVEPITYFEVTTAAAFLAFARQPADLLLLETGLGGRLDATNVVARPELTVITPISIDHVQYLGETLEQIAAEKAGILKPGVPCVVGPQRPEVLAVIEARARQLSSPLSRAGLDWRAGSGPGTLLFEARGSLLRLPRPALPGAHQIDNAACAVAAAQLLEGHGLTPATMARGLLEVHWPGRLQRLDSGRLAALLPEGWELWLDGGHNAAAGEVLGRVLTDWRDQPVHLICGMMNSKAIDDFLAPLAAGTRSLHAVAIPGEPNSLRAAETAAAAARAGIHATVHDGVEAALHGLFAQHRVPGRILICGSLYLAGAVLAYNG